MQLAVESLVPAVTAVRAATRLVFMAGVVPVGVVAPEVSAEMVVQQHQEELVGMPEPALTVEAVAAVATVTMAASVAMVAMVAMVALRAVRFLEPLKVVMEVMAPTVVMVELAARVVFRTLE